MIIIILIKQPAAVVFNIKLLVTLGIATVTSLPENKKLYIFSSIAKFQRELERCKSGDRN